MKLADLDSVKNLNALYKSAIDIRKHLEGEGLSKIVVHVFSSEMRVDQIYGLQTCRDALVRVADQTIDELKAKIEAYGVEIE